MAPARASSSASTSPRSERRHPQAIGVILGGHGITAWGDTSEECEANSLEIIRTAETFIAEHGRPEPFGPVDRRATRRCPRPSARARAAALRRSCAASPPPTGRRSATTPTARSCSTSSSRAEHPRLAALGTSCPDHFLRTKVRPMVLDLPPTRRSTTVVARLRELHAAYRDGLPRLLRAPRRRRTARPMRGADPAIVLVPGVGMF